MDYQTWIFIGRTDAEAETPILWSPDMKNWLLGKDPDAGKDWRQEEKEMTEDEMVRWHHRFDGCEFKQTLGVGDGQGILVCYSPWGPKSQTRLSDNWTELMGVDINLSRFLETNVFISMICFNVEKKMLTLKFWKQVLFSLPKISASVSIYRTLSHFPKGVYFHHSAYQFVVMQYLKLQGGQTSQS